jgi:allantoinase
VRCAVVSRRVITPTGECSGAVIIEGETIVGIEDPSSVHSRVDHVTDVGDAVLMAGLVDCHVHVNEPGRTQWEGFVTATRAAAAGGVTTLVDMPLNCSPVTTSPEALQVKLRACAHELHVDVGFWGGVVPGNTAQLRPLAEAGVLGCKAFLVHSGIDEFPNVGAAQLREAMAALREAGIPLLAHAELDLGDASRSPDVARSDYASWLSSRPRAWEDAAIELLIGLCEETGCGVHIVHLSSADSITQLRAARARGLPITVETCAHYLCFAAEDVPRGATAYKCAPPIREAENRERLWDALAEGVIDFVVTDHSPCTPGLKSPDTGDFHDAWGGVASLQLGLGAVWTEAAGRGHDLCALARWLAEEPARFAGLSTRKGRIEPGLDADLVAWNPDERFEVVPELLHFKHKVSPYLGRTLRGTVDTTWLRGHKIYDRGQVADVPRGRPLLHRQAFAQETTRLEREPP